MSKGGGKYLFQVLDQRLSDQVRHVMRGLNKLTALLVDAGVDFSKNKGLWLPAVADGDHGDFQVNLMVSPSWSTRKVMLNDVLRFAATDQCGMVGKHLSLLNKDFVELRLCRDAGKGYRVAIRHDSGERRVHYVNDFCITLGSDVVINETNLRPRPKRKDAWRGVIPPLFTFSGNNGQLWYVYPPPQ